MGQIVPQSPGRANSAGICISDFWPPELEEENKFQLSCPQKTEQIGREQRFSAAGLIDKKSLNLKKFSLTCGE